MSDQEERSAAGQAPMPARALTARPSREGSANAYSRPVNLGLAGGIRGLDSIRSVPLVASVRLSETDGERLQAGLRAAGSEDLLVIVRQNHLQGSVGIVAGELIPRVVSATDAQRGVRPIRAPKAAKDAPWVHCDEGLERRCAGVPEPRLWREVLSLRRLPCERPSAGGCEDDLGARASGGKVGRAGRTGVKGRCAQETAGKGLYRAVRQVRTTAVAAFQRHCLSSGVAARVQRW